MVTIWLTSFVSESKQGIQQISRAHYNLKMVESIPDDKRWSPTHFDYHFFFSSTITLTTTFAKLCDNFGWHNKQFSLCFISYRLSLDLHISVIYCLLILGFYRISPRYYCIALGWGGSQCQVLYCELIWTCHMLHVHERCGDIMF